MLFTVIVTFNRKKLLKECIDSVLNQTYKSDKIIILNNCSTDGTLDMLNSDGYFKKSNIEIVTLETNTGGAGGFYYAMKKAYSDGADWIWVMDDDCIPEKNALEALVNASKLVDGSFFASCVFGPNNEFMNVPTLSNHKSDNGYKDWYEHLDKKIVKIEAATFVSLLISRNSIDNCGLPHKDFFIWGDDIEYTTRLTKTYKTAYMVGDSRVVHKRVGEKALSLVNELNKNRIKMYKYYVRNNKVIAHYYLSFSKRILASISYFVILIKIIFVSKYKTRKIITFFKGEFGYLFGNYNRNGFKKRFKNHLD